MQLTTIAPAEYAREILPQSSALWAAGRSLDQYVDDFTAVATSAYGKRRFRTLGLRIDGKIVVSCKRYERELRCSDRLLRAIGIGAVFTPPALRGRGYASAMLGALLDGESAAGTDVAYLFSDIHPVFYERLRFIRLPSRTISLRADALPATRLAVGSVEDSDWPAIRRCFEALDNRRALTLRRTPLVWEHLQTSGRADRNAGESVRLIARPGRGACAYVFGRRFPKVDAFALDEYAYTGDGGFDAVAPLIRAAAGDLRKVTGWLPPDIARSALPRGAVKKRTKAIAMAALLSSSARAMWKGQGTLLMNADADPCWSADHV